MFLVSVCLYRCIGLSLFLPISVAIAWANKQSESTSHRRARISSKPSRCINYNLLCLVFFVITSLESTIYSFSLSRIASRYANANTFQPQIYFYFEINSLVFKKHFLEFYCFWRHFSAIFGGLIVLAFTHSLPLCLFLFLSLFLSLALSMRLFSCFVYFENVAREFCADEEGLCIHKKGHAHFFHTPHIICKSIFNSPDF